MLKRTLKITSVIATGIAAIALCLTVFATTAYAGGLNSEIDNNISLSQQIIDKNSGLSFDLRKALNEVNGMCDDLQLSADACSEEKDKVMASLSMELTKCIIKHGSSHPLCISIGEMLNAWM